MHAHWDDLGKDLLFSFPYIQHTKAPATCAWVPDHNIESLGRNYQIAEKPHKLEIERAIEIFCQSGHAPNTSPEAAYFLGIRAAVIESFLLQLGSRSDDDIRTVFLLPPDMTMKEAARWLFIYWWECQGAGKATLMRIIDDFYEHSAS